MANKTLSDEVMNSTVFLGRLTHGTFDLEDVRDSIKKLNKELIELEDICLTETDTMHIKEKMRKVFGDALVSGDEQ